jgi:hypothetical protein
MRGTCQGGYRVYRALGLNVNQAHHEVATMCRVLGVSKSDFYGWNDRRCRSVRERISR